MPEPRFSPSARRTALALARATIRQGTRFRGGDERTVETLERMLAGFGRGTVHGYGRLLGALEQAPRLTHRGRGFSKLEAAQAESYLERCVDGALPLRTLVFALSAPLKVAHFDDRQIYKKLDAVFEFQSVGEQEPRYMQRVTRGADFAEDTEIECDAVVVGTGAGGAVVAKELAERGHAVLMIEEGDYFTRRDFTGRGVDALRRFYRGRGTLGSIGNTFIPIPMGRLVGGSTAINTGTCWRTPEWVLRRWVEREGLEPLGPDRMAPYFERVERELGVERASFELCGGVGRVIARGADLLGYSHRPLDRNAPGCDGSGVCDMGCPTDARRSTNLSYVPSALLKGAELWCGVRVERLLREGEIVTGVEGRSVVTHKRVRVRSRATVLACGTIPTPVLLQRNGFGRGLPQLGKNLSIHPATTVSALFDEPIRGYAAIPQGYTVDEFRHEGILLLGASAPIDLGAGQFAFVGKKFAEVMEAYDRVASFGVMVEDASRGRVRPGPKGRPLIFYRVGAAERERLRRGTEILTRIYLAAGAREVYPALAGHRVIRDAEGLGKLARARPAASDWLLTAFHPLGTCRMAKHKRRGVVSLDHEVFGAPGLFIADGSVVPSSVAVNPQVTIMALATRGAERIGSRIE